MVHIFKTNLFFLITLQLLFIVLTVLSEARRENMSKLSIENQNINKTFKQKNPSYLFVLYMPQVS